MLAQLLESICQEDPCGYGFRLWYSVVQQGFIESYYTIGSKAEQLFYQTPKMIARVQILALPVKLGKGSYLFLPRFLHQ